MPTATEFAPVACALYIYKGARFLGRQRPATASNSFRKCQARILAPSGNETKLWAASDYFNEQLIATIAGWDK